MEDFRGLETFIRELYPNEEFVALHRPLLQGNEKKYLNQCIDSTFVSYHGEFVNKLESMVCEITGAKNAVALSSGTAALHMALVAAGVKKDDEVITQALTFVATGNSILYCNAHPVFLDSDTKTLGLCPKALKNFLSENAVLKDGMCFNKNTDRRIKSCIPMHVFGNACEIEQIVDICKSYNIKVVEDSAEAFGSTLNGKHLGTFSDLGIYSFNGNKIVTSGGGGVIVTDDNETAQRIRHISTTAKASKDWHYRHDQMGFNYRMPNVNAAVVCAQIEKLDEFLADKAKVHEEYKKYFQSNDIEFIEAREDSKSNNWLNALIAKDLGHRDEILEYFNSHKIMMRPLWDLLPTLEFFKGYYFDGGQNAKHFFERVVCIPSSVRSS